ncbi:MAG: hypothetical protein ACKO0M_16265, partial [Cyanobium sp.]
MPRPTAQSRHQRALRGPAGLLSMAVAAAGLALLPHQPPAWAQTTTARDTTAAMAELSARQAADRILTAVKNRDANAYYALLAPAAQRVSSAQMASQAFRAMPQLLSWTITEIA